MLPLDASQCLKITQNSNFFVFRNIETALMLLGHNFTPFYWVKLQADYILPLFVGSV